MKTICTLNGRIIMSQDGNALAAMQKNAEQYEGAEVSIISDEDFSSVLSAQVAQVAASENQRALDEVLAIFPGMTKEQQKFMAKLAVGRG